MHHKGFPWKKLKMLALRVKRKKQKAEAIARKRQKASCTSKGKCKVIYDNEREIPLMGNRVGFAGLVLAETLIGLDMVKGNPTAQFSGSPLLLQVWLYEKLRVWDAPERLPYNSDHCAERHVIREFPTEVAWKAWMKTRKGDRIQWVCPWYGIGSMTVSTMNHFGVAVIGVTRVVFYFPARFQRQFGVGQTVILGDPEYVVSKVHDASFRRNVLRLWPKRVMQEVAANFVDKLSGSYKCWLKKNLLKDKSAKRRKT